MGVVLSILSWIFYSLIVVAAWLIGGHWPKLPMRLWGVIRARLPW